MKRSSSFLFLVLAIFLPSCAGLHAAIEKDLGQALAYFRVTSASEDQKALIDTIEHRGAVVIDLRNVTAGAEFAAALHDSLAKTPPPHAARIFLVNASTSMGILHALDDDALLSVITLAPKTSTIDADIQITVTDDEEKTALAALANGAEIEKLISNSRDKRRYDEAKLVHDHANGVAPADSELPADADDDSVTEPAKEKKPADTAKKADQPPHDHVLERAVQLHRSLLALKKL